MFAVVEYISGTVQQVVVYKTKNKAMDCFKRFAKQNKVDLGED